MKNDVIDRASRGLSTTAKPLMF